MNLTRVWMWTEGSVVGTNLSESKEGVRGDPEERG